MIQKARFHLRIYKITGRFAEDKDVAREIRENILWPKVRTGIEVELDFHQVEDATQSFIHALLSKLIRETQGEVLDLVYFKNCNDTVKRIINMVVEYMVED